jgi:DNA (cytosine-5)-methyltransferase 1
MRNRSLASKDAYGYGEAGLLNELALFAGGGGGLLGSYGLGWHTICAVEIDHYCREILLCRQADGLLEPFPIWDDIRTFDATPWRGKVDIITGGFPCQGISSAGKRLGLSDPRSGLIFEMLSIINEIRPRFILAENSPHLRTNGLGSILQSLAEMGYDAQWGVLGAWHAGAPHKRDRLWLVAYSDSGGEHALPLNAKVACASEHIGPWATEPGVGRVAYGVANRMDRLRAVGNGQVPAVVKIAWETLKRSTSR